MTMINGKIVYKDGEYLTLDKKEIIENCNKLVQELKL